VNPWPLHWSVHRTVQWNRKMRMPRHGRKIWSSLYQSDRSKDSQHHETTPQWRAITSKLRCPWRWQGPQSSSNGVETDPLVCT
jgi:hypothetical protein